MYQIMDRFILQRNAAVMRAPFMVQDQKLITNAISKYYTQSRGEHRYSARLRREEMYNRM